MLYWLPYLQITDTPEQVCRDPPTRSSPRIAAFVGVEAIQYFILVEQCVLCQVPSLQHAVFLTFCSILRISFGISKASKNALLFFQDYILAYPDSQRRPATYLATASDIKKLANSQWESVLLVTMLFLYTSCRMLCFIVFLIEFCCCTCSI